MPSINEYALRARARGRGCSIRKSRSRSIHASDLGGYLLVDDAMNCCVLGDRSGQNFLPSKWQPNMKNAAILLCTALAIGTILPAPPAQAQTYDPDYPVCLQIYDDIAHFYFECRYTSMAQCATSASGRAAQCVVNPYYAQPAPRKKRSHK